LYAVSWANRGNSGTALSCNTSIQQKAYYTQHTSIFTPQLKIMT